MEKSRIDVFSLLSTDSQIEILTITKGGDCYFSVPKVKVNEDNFPTYDQLVMLRNKLGSYEKVANHYGVTRGTIYNWLRKADDIKSKTRKLLAACKLDIEWYGIDKSIN